MPGAAALVGAPPPSRDIPDSGSDTSEAPSPSQLAVTPHRTITHDSQSPGSPSASVALLRTAETLQGLSRQLEEINDNRLAESDPDLFVRCCCGAVSDCPTLAARARVDAKLKLAGEIGTTLLQRYDALEHKFHRAEHQVEIKRKALADSLRHVANLERANNTHIAKYTDLTHSFDDLEKKYTQAMHEHTLTVQSLTVCRAELAKCRSTASANTIALATGASAEERLADAERRFQDARDLHQAESKKLREQVKWRKMAEERIADLESKLTAAGREVEEARATRARDAQDLLSNAKDRFEALHAELYDTLHADSPAELPEYQRTLEDLVASNALLKHDASELSRTLTQTLEENRVLRDELEEHKLRQTPRSRPLSMEISHVRPMLLRGHGRTGSNPVIPTETRPPMHARVASATSRTSTWEAERRHRRQSSVAPSFTSTSTTEGPSLMSPSPAPGDYGSPMMRSESPSHSMSPEARLVRGARHSFSAGIPYTVNGVVKSKRPNTQRTASDRRNRHSLSMRPMGSINDIGEPRDEGDGDPSAEVSGISADRSGDTSLEAGSGSDEPPSPSGMSCTASEASRKRASVLLPNMTSPRTPFENISPMMEAGGFDLPTPHPAVPPEVLRGEKRGGRRALLLLSRSTGVQTDPLPQIPEPAEKQPETPSEQEFSRERDLGHERHESRASATCDTNLGELIEFLNRILTRLRGVDIQTLNRRLKKQHLPSDVGHVSRTTLSSLNSEINDMRHQFRNVLDLSAVSRREMTVLLKLLKDAFSSLLELQGVVNDVTLNPKIAKKLRREAFDEVGDVPPSGLWGIAAPITSWLAAPAKTETLQPSPQRSTSNRQPKAPERQAPKLQASTSATTTHISVEFGGAGHIRRAAPATPKKTNLTAVVGGADVFSQKSPTRANASKTPGPPSPTRASRRNRSDLMGIFAGAQAPIPLPKTQNRVRHASSQYFNNRPLRSVTEPKDRLSTIVDAVIDPREEDREPEMVHRTMRPRGLSDSSIRSVAFNIDPAPPPGVVHDSNAVQGRALSAAVSAVGSGLGSISRRIYGFAAYEDKETSAPAPEVVSKADATDTPRPAVKGTAKDITSRGTSTPSRDTPRDSPKPPLATLAPEPQLKRKTSSSFRERAAAVPIATLAVSQTTALTGVSPTSHGMPEIGSLPRFGKASAHFGGRR